VANLSAGGQVNPSLMLPALFALQKLACDRVQPGVDSAALLALRFRGHHDVGDLQRWRFARQRKHLVHSNSGLYSVEDEVVNCSDDYVETQQNWT
jgi:hypothetical protein